MKNIVITGGTDGMGKVTALHLLKKGERVLVVGSTASKGEKFLAEAQQLGAGERASFIQANLSSVAENQRLIETIASRFDKLDMLIFCAGKYQNQYQATPEGFEMVFATYYLSRYLLSYGLQPLLSQAPQPIIMSVAAPGINGAIQWDDLQFRANFDGLKASFYGSRLNDLLGVAFAENSAGSRIRYILYNPGFVRTAGVTEAFDNLALRLVVKVVARVLALSPEQGAAHITRLLDTPPNAPFTAYSRRKPVDLSMDTFNLANAQRLDTLTRELLGQRRSA